MRFALRVLDDILAEAMAWARTNPELVVVFASSMGQDAVHRDYHEGVEILVDQLPLLMQHAGLDPSDYSPLLAMVPQVAVEIPDAVKRQNAKATLESAVAGHDHPFIIVREVGVSLSITVATPPLAVIESDRVRIGNRDLTWNSAGFRREAIDPGTGYHVPQGSLAVYSASTAAPLAQERATVPADRLKSWMLDVISGGPSRIRELRRLAQ